MRTFIMGDIHGAYYALLQCLEKVDFNYENDTLIQLGDVVDRHPQSYECVELLLKIKNLVAISGNHDYWFNEFIKLSVHPEKWMHGGQSTLISYLKHAGKVLPSKLVTLANDPLLRKDVPPAHQEFFAKQKLYFIDHENNCFVHAGFDPDKSFIGQQPIDYFQNRRLWTLALQTHIHNLSNPGSKSLFQPVTSFRHIFIGHTPTQNWNMDKPMKAFNIYNLDTGAGHDGKLTIMDLHSKIFWQSDPVTSFYKKQPQNI